MKGFSFFCGAGGSSIGYKKSGIDIIGGCDIDKKQLDIYKHFQKPKIVECRDIRDYLEQDFNYLYNLDLIDGSPPCTNFSVCNINRQDKQFKAKKYAEGSTMQTLEDLTLVYLQVVNKYQPKYFVMENVPNLNKQYAGLLNYYIDKSNITKNYRLHKLYLDPANLGGYTSRSRFFLVGEHKNNTTHLGYIQTPNIKPKTLSDIWETLEWDNVNYNSAPQSIYQRWLKLKDSSLKNIHTTEIINKNSILPVISTKPNFLHPCNPQLLSVNSLAKAQGFNYNWSELNLSKSRILYAIGMSVHPLCTEFLGNMLIKGNYDYLFTNYNNVELQSNQLMLGF